MANEVAAFLFLLTLAVVPVAWYVVVARRSPFTLVQWTLRSIAVLLVRLLWRAHLPRHFPLAEHQGGVIICNHRSSVDPFFVQAALRRPVYWMAAREYCEHYAFRAFLRAAEVIPVGRAGVDTAATKMAIRRVAEGGLVGMLPEGRINMTERFMLPARPGSVLIALRAKAPIVPCYIEGSPYDRRLWSPLLMSARVRIQFGQPIDLTNYEGSDREPGVVEELMLRCIRQLAEMAGRHDFQPKLAGRRWKPTEDELQADMNASVQRRARKGR